MTAQPITNWHRHQATGPYHRNRSNVNLKTQQKIVTKEPSPYHTLFDGHAQVSLAKSAVVASEYIISAYVPGGIILVLGFELLNANIHLTDSLYKSIDPTYE